MKAQALPGETTVFRKEHLQKQGLKGIDHEQVQQLNQSLKEHPHQIFQAFRDGSTNHRFSFNDHYSSVRKKIDPHTLQMALKMPKNYSQSLRPQYQSQKVQIKE